MAIAKAGSQNISKADSQKMQQLAQEGRRITEIVRDEFPKLTYWDVYIEVYGAGKRSAQGVKHMITTRLTAMAASKSKSERAVMLDELQGLVWHLYENHKANQRKLAAIRAALKE
jgi:hypothetical protein